MFSQCSKNCEGGIKLREVQCFDLRDQRPLRPFHCRAMSSRPQTTMPCNLQPCLEWYTSSWGQVSNIKQRVSDFVMKCSSVYTDKISKWKSGKKKKSGRQSAGRHCLSMIACTQEYDFGCRVNIFQLPEECDVSEDFVLLSGLPHNLYVTKMVTVNGLSMSKKPPQFNFYQIN